MWSEERVALLRKLWAEGYTGSEIANELGGVTRNAVIGKVHRLGLAARATQYYRPRPPRPVRARVSKPRNMSITRMVTPPRVIKAQVRINPTDPAAIAAAAILAGALAAERRRKNFIETTRLGR